MNIQLAKKVIDDLAALYNVDTFCVCSGSRNVPFVYALSTAKGFTTFPFFDERSAGFFALGCIRRTHHPVAVITTSGTAVAELLPSVVEAYYSSLPLILLTADRPSILRRTAAPQTIQQIGIFSHYVDNTFDLENSLDFDLSQWSARRPCHINVCFDEPLLDIKHTPVQTRNSPSGKKKFDFIVNKDEQWSEDEKTIADFFSASRNPVFILSEMPNKFRGQTEDILSHLKCPIYAEALSGLRESDILDPLILKSGDKILNEWVLDKKIDGVIRMGRRPCTRFWMDLEKKHSSLPVLSVSDQSYSGLSRRPSAVSFKSFFKFSDCLLNKRLCPPLEALIQQDRQRAKTLQMLLKKYPLSEQSLVQSFSSKIPANSLLFLGNSLPIREWHLSATYKNNKLKYTGNRGVNGIDGLISSFLGESQASHQNWCLLGDLSCLYDLTAPWVLKHLPNKGDYFIVVINNGGGQIFSSLPALSSLPSVGSALLRNPHQLTFEKWAQLWDMHYYQLEEWPEKFCFQSPAVIELVVHRQQTQQLTEALKQL